MNIRQERDRELAPRSRLYFPFLDDLQERMSQMMWFGNERQSDITLSEDDEHVFVEANLPGLKSSDIDISINENTLWIKGERQEEAKNKERKTHSLARRSFFYHLDLPSEVKENSEQAEFEDGVLKLTFRKAQPSQARKITLSSEKSHSRKS